VGSSVGASVGIEVGSATDAVGVGVAFALSVLDDVGAARVGIELGDPPADGATVGRGNELHAATARITADPITDGSRDR